MMSATASATTTPLSSPMLRPTNLSLNLTGYEPSSLSLAHSAPPTPPLEDPVQETKRNLERTRVFQRTRIAELYSGLLKSQAEPNYGYMQASHNWNLNNIESIVNDLLNENRKPRNPASKYFTSVTDETKHILVMLRDALAEHESVSTRVEQFDKGIY